MEIDGGLVRKIIQRIAGTADKDNYSFELATVTAVYLTGSNQWTCDATPVSGENTAPINGIQLTVEIASNGFILVPTVGSNILVLLTDRNEYYCVLCSEVDQCIFYRDNGNGTFQSFVVNASGITMGDGSYGGLIKIVDLVTKINNLENLLNDLISKWNAFSSAYTPGSPTTLGTPPTAEEETGSISPITQRSDLENTNINHGIPLT